MKIVFVKLVLGFLALFSCRAETSTGIHFSSTEVDEKITTTCKRDGQIIYKYVLIDKDQSYFAYVFYWDKAEAATILRTSDEFISIEQAANLPVSFSFTLDESQQPLIVSITNPEGKVIDGLLLKAGGRLTPLATSELSQLD